MTDMKKILLNIVLLMISALASAQGNVTVKGSVKDTKGEPVIGAVVMLEGSTATGTVSDPDGNYSLSIPSSLAKKARLNISCLSYQSQTVDVAGRTVIDFVLNDDSEQLDEAVIVGYGSMRRHHRICYIR